MGENFFKEFVCFMETYIDEQIVKESDYRRLSCKCIELSEKVKNDSSLKKEYEYEINNLDSCYRSYLCQYSMKYLIELMRNLGDIRT